jgi:hypothetical protein
MNIPTLFAAWTAFVIMTLPIESKGQERDFKPLGTEEKPNSLMVRIDFERRAELMKAEPDVYYLTNHYANHPCSCGYRISIVLL